jgi:hypothetical protein
MQQRHAGCQRAVSGARKAEEVEDISWRKERKSKVPADKGVCDCVTLMSAKGGRRTLPIIQVVLELPRAEISADDDGRC